LGRLALAVGAVMLAVGMSSSPVAAASGPILVKDINPTGSSFPTGLTQVGNKVFFAADDGIHGNELWVSDGTTAGTKMVKNIRPKARSSYPENLVNVNGTLFYTANDGTHGRELWKSDGTATGTKMVKNIMPEPPAPYTSDGLYVHERLTVIGSKVYFFNDPLYGDESQLWVSNGTAAGTRQLARDQSLIVPPVSDEWWRDGMASVGKAGGKFYFVAEDAEASPGYQLWVSDGTAAGTHRQAGAPAAARMSILPVNGTMLYFYTDRLWRTNGTKAGTIPLTAAGKVPYRPETSAYMAKRLYFGESGMAGALWKTDGTPSGTKQIAGGAVADLISAGGLIYWSSHGYLEASDGTAAGTRDLAQIGTWPLQLVAVGANVCFLAADESSGTTQLWETDGTSAGTYPVRSFAGDPGELGAAVGGRFFLAADDGVHGVELWSYTP